MIFNELKHGSSVEGKELKAFRSDFKGDKYTYLLAGVHGDEVEGVYILSKLFDWLKENDDLELPIIVIPILNEDGYRVGTRKNAHDIDLNRNLPTQDWTEKSDKKKYYPGTKPLSEPENVFLDKLLQKFPPKLMISFHSWKPLINYNGDCKDIADLLSQYNHYEVVENIGYPTPGSLGTYAPEKYKTPVITFECPTIDESEKALKDIWNENQKALTELFISKLS